MPRPSPRAKSKKRKAEEGLGDSLTCMRCRGIYGTQLYFQLINRRALFKSVIVATWLLQCNGNWCFVSLLRQLYTRFQRTQKAVKPSVSSRRSDIGTAFARALLTEKTEQLVIPANTEAYICRQPCLQRLQRLQKLKKDVLELRTNILGSLDSLYPSQTLAQPTSSCEVRDHLGAAWKADTQSKF